MNETVKMILLLLLITLLISASSMIIGIINSIPPGNIALIHIDGEIISLGGFFDTSISSDEIISLIESAEDNPNVEAIVLSINSPGGQVIACKEVANKVRSSTKPVIAWIREIGTSGAYLIASSSDYIISDELSILGSIGATMSYVEFSGTLEKYGAEYARLVSGDYKDMGSFYKNLTIEEREILMVIINESFTYFLNYLTEQRNLTSSSVNIISDGRIFNGRQASELGLVDELGSRQEVITYLESIGLTEFYFETYSSKGLFFELPKLFGYKTSLIFPTYD